MKTIILKSIFTSFKGIVNLNVEFSQSTDIMGANRSGKTTLRDAIQWLITGKESGDSKKFPLQRIDTKTGNIIGDDVFVEADFQILENGEVTDLKIKREHVQVWGAAKRGSSERVHKGNTDNFYWNNAPIKTETEFLKRITDVFGSEEQFKLLSNPIFFNESIEWKKRREILEALSGGPVTSEYIISLNPELKDIAGLIDKKSISDIRAEWTTSKKALAKEQETIKTRIEESLRGKVEDVNEDDINAQIATHEKSINAIDKQMSDISEQNNALNKSKIDLQNQIHALESDNLKIKRSLQNEYDAEMQDSTAILDSLVKKYDELLNRIKSGKRYVDDLIDQKEKSLKSIQQLIDIKNDQLDRLRTEYDALDASTFHAPDENGVCPHCQMRPHPEDMGKNIRNLEDKFNTDKVSRIELMNQEGQRKVQEVSDLMVEYNAKQIERNAEIDKYKSSVDKLQLEADAMAKDIEPLRDEKPVIKSVDERLADNDQYWSNEKAIQTLDMQLSNLSTDTPAVNNELSEQKRELTSKIYALRDELMKNVRNKDIDKRVAELKQQSADIGQQMSDADGILFNVDEYERLKYEEVERRVNSKFKIVQFRMANKLQNGGYEPTCVAMVDNVPYVQGGLNTAGKLAAGIDTINTLSEFFNMKLPILIDNRESATEIPPINTQVINFKVSPSHDKLTVLHV